MLSLYQLLLVLLLNVSGDLTPETKVDLVLPDQPGGISLEVGRDGWIKFSLSGGIVTQDNLYLRIDGTMLRVKSAGKENNFSINLPGAERVGDNLQIDNFIVPLHIEKYELRLLSFKVNGNTATFSREKDAIVIRGPGEEGRLKVVKAPL